MNWIINFIWDYFKCPKCDKYKQREDEILKLVEDLVKTQTEIIEYLNLDKSGRGKIKNKNV